VRLRQGPQRLTTTLDRTLRSRAPSQRTIRRLVEADRHCFRSSAKRGCRKVRFDQGHGKDKDKDKERVVTADRAETAKVVTPKIVVDEGGMEDSGSRCRPADERADF